MQPAPTGPGPSPQQYVDADIRALSRIRYYSVVGILGIVVSFVTTFVIVGQEFLSFSLGRGAVPAPGAPPKVYAGLLGEYLGLMVVGAALSIAAFIFLFQGLNALGSVDPLLRTPAKLVPLIPVGIVLVYGAVALLLDGGINTQAPTGYSTSPSLLGSAALLVILGIVLLLLGVVGGEILGLWRVGGRYHEDLIRAGAILLIIPVLNLVSPILVYIGSSSALSHVRQQMVAHTP
jgi:hypothetical protein